MDDSEFYDPQLQLVDMREREGLRGMAAFRRRAQDLCNRGYKPWERNDAKTGAGRKKKTRKKRGGNTEEVNRQLRLLVDQVLQNHTRIQELEQWQDAYEELNLEERIEALERQRSGTGGTGGGKRKKKTRKKIGGNSPLEFQGKAELLQLIINEIQGLGGIFQTKEYNMVQNDYESTNIYIKKQDIENLPPDANGIPVYMVDNNNNPTNDRHTLPIAVLTMGYILIRKRGGDWFKSKDSQFQLSGGRRKKRGAVKFGKNKTTAEIVKEGRKILQTTPQKEKRKKRERQIKLTGEKEFALFKKQAMDRMKIAFIKSFNQPPSVKDGKMLSLVYKSLKQPLNKKENEIIQDYRAENNINKRKLVWMNNSARQLRVMSEKTKHQIYNTADDPEVIKKYRPRKKQIKMGPASGLVVDTNKYMSPVKGPDTRYPRLSLDIGERGKSHKNLFKGGRKKKTRKKRGGNGEEKVPTPSFRDIVRQTIANNWTQISNDSEISNHGTMENMINTFIDQPRDTQLRMMRAYDDRNGTRIFQHLYEIPVESQKINEIYFAQKSMEGGKRKKKRRTRKKNRR